MTLGDRVHYVLYRERTQDNECKHAVVAAIKQHGQLDVAVFLPTPVGQIDVPHDPDRRPGTWHWPSAECEES